MAVGTCGHLCRQDDDDEEYEDDSNDEEFKKAQALAFSHPTLLAFPYEDNQYCIVAVPGDTRADRRETTYRRNLSRENLVIKQRTLMYT